MKFGTTHTSQIDFGSNKKIASRRLGSSFQKAQPTSAKIFRRRIFAACASVGALESGFTVEPCATIKSALSLLKLMQLRNVQRPTACPERKSNGSTRIEARCGGWEFSAARNYLLAAFAAATILSKRLSPRRSSQRGFKRRSPYVGPAGIFATISSSSSARALSPVHA